MVNATTGALEKVSRIYRVRADEYVEINDHVRPGDIVAIGGLDKATSGDTFLQNRKQIEHFKLPRVVLPNPVFFCQISADREA